MITINGNIVNIFFRKAHLPNSLTTAILKKSTLIPEDFSNYCFISSLQFLGRKIEEVITTKLQQDVTSDSILDASQPAFRPGHSADTALVAVKDDSLMATDTGEISMLMSLTQQTT